MIPLTMVLLAAAITVFPREEVSRARLARPVDAPAAGPRPPASRGGYFAVAAALAGGLAATVLLGGVRGLIAGALVGGGVYVAARRARRTASERSADPLELAGVWDLLAACLRAGMSVPAALGAVAGGVSEPAGPALRRAAELLALGADPEQAWAPALECPPTARLARSARRSGHSGAALAESLTDLAHAVRAGAREQSEARAQRIAVLIAGPLGLCFLPAFLALGVVPVVIGLAQGVMQRW